jgi:outer membrane receptor protein involved in Fe transport
MTSKTGLPIDRSGRARVQIALLLASLLAASSTTAQTAGGASAAEQARLLAKYDANKNGVLDPDELTAKMADDERAVKSQAKTNEAIELSPFEVKTNKDTSYGALNSNSISLFNMELLKTPVAADIFTEQFMQDVGTTTVEDLLNGYGAGVGQVLATPDSDSNNNQPGDRFSVAQVGSRGLTAGSTRRNGFLASSTRTSITDTFDTERVEVIKGPNAALFGSSGAGGFANTGSKTAKFAQHGEGRYGVESSAKVTSRVDQYGSKRWEFDGNIGLEKLAFRFVALNEDQNYRRLFIGAKTEAFYGALAAKLPFHTKLNLTGRKTDNDRIIPTRNDSLSFGNATKDPRHNYSLLYMLATDQAGATNPGTGAAYPAGPIVNGNLSWDNASSWSGRSQSEDIATETYTLNLDTVWTKWLATQVAAMYDGSVSQRGPDGGSLLAPKSFNTSNPLDEWANSSTFRMDRSASRRHAYRISALLTNDLFHDRAHSQTVFGYDLDFTGGGNTNYRYYEADSNWTAFSNDNPRPTALGGTTGANALGRFEMPTVTWSVQNGPTKNPGPRIGARRYSVNGRNYVLLQQNPRNPNFVTPTNPLGLATLSGIPGYSGIGGANASNYAEENKFWGMYGANYTSWFQDRFTTLVGYRISHSFSRRANTSTSGTEAYRDTPKTNKSYNFGLTYRIKPWLYSYYNIGQTFDPFKGSNNAYGDAPLDTEGFSQEIGFKYEPGNGRFSGSIAYYKGRSKNENFNYGTGNRDLINPVGLNDAFNAANRNQWVSLDKESSGLEIILTAAPTKNWRARFGFTQQDGKIKTDTSFNILWNDEFYYNKATGGVTYADGTPFMVPTDTAGVATVSSTSALRAPVTGATNSQLTLAMMSDPNSDYYAYGKGATQHTTNGRIANNSVVFRALRWFQTTGGSGLAQQARTLRTGLLVKDIPYAFNDPIGYKGVAVLSVAGEPTIGHPLYRFVFTNTYDFTEGRLRGLSVGGTIRWDIDKRTYWYLEPDGNGGNTRHLYKEVDINPQVSPTIAYSRKIGRYGFRTQMNINNIFNKYKVDLRPDGSTGFTREDNIGATFVGEPRQYVWTNSITF